MDARGDVALQRPSFGIRLSALVRRPQLDRKLAEGRAPVTALARFRAQQLTSQARRRRLAAGLLRLTREAERQAVRRGSAVPLNRAAIRHCRGLLREVAAELVDEGPVTPRGILRLQGLLRDGSSPIYSRAPQDALELELRHARTTLFLL
jgi:hypothetical protein